MSKTLLAILAVPAERDLVARHWKYFNGTGYALLGCGPESGEMTWPEPIARLDTGIMGKKQTPVGSSLYGLVYQEIDIWRYFLEHKEFDSVCICEADGVFVRPMPKEHPGGPYLVSLMPNWSPANHFKTSTYFQTPRWSDRPTTEQLYRHGLIMARDGDTEYDISDRFPAWICYKQHIKFQGFPAWSPFANTHWSSESFDAQWISDARCAIKCGAFYIHACKTEAQLKSIEDLIQLT